MPLIIRQATIEDLEQLSFLFDAYRSWYHQPPDREKALQFLDERMRHQESVIYLAEEAGTLLGFTQLYPIFSSVSMSRAWLLNDLFVQEQARGRGIATHLLQAARQHGCNTAAKWLMLQTSCDNLAAKALYEKSGWRRETDHFYMLDL